LLYSGPVDGHDARELERVFTLARGLKGPVVIHILTQKGQGYGPAVADEVEQFHSLSGPIDIESGQPTRQAPTMYTSVFAETMCELAAARPEIVAITAAMASPTKLDAFARLYPDRFFHVGIAEQHPLTFAAVLAAEDPVPGGVLVLGTGRMAAVARDAARRLDKEGVAAASINARFVKPLDPRLADWAARCGLLVTVEDNVRHGGFGAGVAEALAEARVSVPHLLLGIPDRFLAHGNIDEIHAMLGLDAEGVVREVAGEIESGGYSPVSRSTTGAK